MDCMNGRCDCGDDSIYIATTVYDKLFEKCIPKNSKLTFTVEDRWIDNVSHTIAEM